MDPKIWIRSAKSEKNLLEADDAKLADLGYVSARATWHTKDTLDPAAVFRAPADGEYLLGIEDTRGRAGADYVYRVEIEPVRDTVYTHITEFNGYQIPRAVGLIVPQGNCWTLDVQLAPGLGNSYKGEIELEAATKQQAADEQNRYDRKAALEQVAMHPERRRRHERPEDGRADAVNQT